MPQCFFVRPELAAGFTETASLVVMEVPPLYVGNWTRFQWFVQDGAMTNRRLAKEILKQLYWLGELDVRPSVSVLAERTASTRSEVAEAISWLDEQELVDANRLRLTLSGLAVAVAMAAAVRSAAA